LDTNVLLHDPYCLFKFEDNNLVIPIEAVEELDAIKMEQSSERGRNARRVHRLLRELLPDSQAMLEGVPLDSGGTLSVVINKYLQGTAKDSERPELVRSILNLKNKDKRIIATALFVQENSPPVILVTKDVNMQLKARAVGIEAEDYFNDKAPEEPDFQSYRKLKVSKYDLQRFASRRGPSRLKIA
jgi:PhoH-like ATPase